jgi:secretion/DNA translocation related CpaE-like protein
MQPRPVVVTDDLDLLDEVIRLAAVAGVEPEVVGGNPAAVRARWRVAPLVVVGADCADRCVALGPARRAGVLLVTRGPAERAAFVAGIALGVAEVVELPAAEQRLVELLSGARAEPAGPPGAVVGVLAGCGGAGASVLAAALAIVAARAGRSPLLVDADPLGGGVDLLLGGESAAGLRWPDLAGLAGPVSPSTLRDALPSLHGVRVLAAARSGPAELPAPALRAVLAAGRRFADPVVADVARSVDPVSEAVLAEAHRVLLVVPDQVRAVAAAARMAAWAGQFAVDLELVVRRCGPRGLAAAEVAATLELPLAGVLGPEPGLAGALERGEPPGRRPRGPLAQLCGRVLAGLGDRAVA